jgi:hypothetical protein
MNRNIAVQVAYDRTNKGVDVRNSSTANFMIDSQDRSNYNESTVLSTQVPPPVTTAANFQIAKPGQNLVSGFFTRLAMTEIVMNWDIQNIRATTADLSGNNFTNISVRTTSNGAISNFPLSITKGNYTVETALDALLVEINTATALTFTMVDSSTIVGEAVGKRAIVAPAGKKFAFYRTTPLPPSPAPFVPNLAQSLGFIVYDLDSFVAGLVAGNYEDAWVAYKPNLLAYNYIDITSSQIASQQKVKDSTTSTFDAIDVIYRWVFAYDDASAPLDGYGYPIIQGYLPFTSRRYLSFPKQVRWDPLLPIGNLTFQTYTDKEVIMEYNELEETFEFKMLMLISEV